MPTESKQATAVRTIKASEFKTKCLELMEEVAESGEEIVITKNGRPVSRLVPYREKRKSWFGRDRDIILIHGEIGIRADELAAFHGDPADRLIAAGR